MKNKAFYLTLLMTGLILMSCASTKTGYRGQKKGYGCPNTAFVQPAAEKSKV